MIKHKKTSAIPDSGDASLVRSSDWNDDHAIENGLDLPNENPSPPPENNARLFARKVGGRMMPAFKGPSGLDSVLQPSLARNKISLWTPAGNSTTVTQFGFAATSGGTATVANVLPTNFYTAIRRLEYLVTTASTTAIAFLQPNGGGQNQYFIGSEGLGGFHIVLRFGGATGMANASHRFYAGMTGALTNPTDVEPNTRSNLIGVGYGSADSNWKLMHKLSTGAVTEIDLGPSFPRQTSDRSRMYELALFCPPGGTSISYEFSELGTSNIATGEITTNIPASTTLMKWVIAASVGGVSNVIGIAVASAYTETDY